MDDRKYVAGLPDASGEFTGTFDLGTPPAEMFTDDQLFPVEVDTYDEPNGAADLLPGQSLVITVNDEVYTFPVDHTELLGGNRVRVWCRRPRRASEPGT